MNKFCTIINELEIYLKNINSIQRFIDASYDKAIITIGWLYSDKDYKSLEDEFYGKLDASIRRSSRRENILNTIIKMDTKEICNKKFIKHENEMIVLKNLFIYLGEIHNKIFSNQIKSLFGSIYCKMIDECTYFEQGKAELYKDRLHQIVFETDNDAINIEIVNKLKKIISIINCILKAKGEEFISIDRTSADAKILEKIREIINEMTTSLEKLA